MRAGHQIKVARALLDISASDFAKLLGVDIDALRTMEAWKSWNHRRRVREVLEAKGIKFLSDGIRRLFPRQSRQFTPAQSRAARAFLNWTQERFANEAGISLSTVKDFEAGRRTSLGRNPAILRHTLEAGGIEFISGNEDGGPGIRLRRESKMAALCRTLETAGIEFIPENGGGPGVRLRRPAAAPAEPAGAAKPASGRKTAPSKKTGRRRS